MCCFLIGPTFYFLPSSLSLKMIHFFVIVFSIPSPSRRQYFKNTKYWIWTADLRQWSTRSTTFSIFTKNGRISASFYLSIELSISFYWTIYIFLINNISISIKLSIYCYWTSFFWTICLFLSNFLSRFSIELSFCLIPGIWHQSCFTSMYLLKSIYDLGRAGTSPTSTEWMRESEWGMWPGPASCNLITFWWTHHLRWTLFFFFFILALQKQRRNRFWYFSLSTR